MEELALKLDTYDDKILVDSIIRGLDDNNIRIKLLTKNNVTIKDIYKVHLQKKKVDSIVLQTQKELLSGTSSTINSKLEFKKPDINIVSSTICQICGKSGHSAIDCFEYCKLKRSRVEFEDDRKYDNASPRFRPSNHQNNEYQRKDMFKVHYNHDIPKNNNSFIQKKWKPETKFVGMINNDMSESKIILPKDEELNFKEME